MYHARAVRDAIELVAVHRALELDVPEAGEGAIRAMADSLGWLRHPDGRLRLINDAAGDHGVDLDRLVTATAPSNSPVAPADGLWWAPTARFAAVCDAALGDALCVDLGEPAPPYQPAHAHAGALAFELDVGGVPLVADVGCSGYDGDPWRPYQRSTAAHSTVVIDGRDQSELWGSFRVARRAQVENVRVTGNKVDCEISGGCRPYHRRSAVHTRRIRRAGRALHVEDHVTGAAGSKVESFVHFGPDWQAERVGDSEVRLRHPSARALVHLEGMPTWSLHRGDRSPPCGWHALGFNHVVPSWSLRASSERYGGEAWRMTIRPEL